MAPSIAGDTAAYAPVLPVAAVCLEREVVLNLLLQLRQLGAVERLQDALGVLDVQLAVLDLLVVDRLGRVDEAQRHGEPVDGLGAATLDAQGRLLLRLLQHEAVLVGDPRLLGRVVGPLRGVVV